MIMVHVLAEKVLSFDGSRQSRKVKLSSHWKKLHLKFRVIFTKMENISLSKYRRLSQKPNWTNFNNLGEPNFSENIIVQLMIKRDKNKQTFTVLSGKKLPTSSFLMTKRVIFHYNWQRNSCNSTKRVLYVRRKHLTEELMLITFSGQKKLFFSSYLMFIKNEVWKSTNPIFSF